MRAKAIFLILLSGLIIQNTFSQTPKQKVVDRVSIGFGIRQTTEQANHLFSVADNESVNQFYPSIIRQDKDLNVDWLYHIVRWGANFDQMVEVIPSGVNNLIMAGTVDSSLWLLKTDTAGGILWEKDIDLFQEDLYVHSMIPNSVDGGVAFCASYDQSVNSFADIHVFNFDSNGDTLWTSSITPPSGKQWRNPEGFVDQNGDYVVLLRNNPGYTADIIKLNGTNGQVVDHFELTDQNGANIYLTGFLETSSGIYLAGRLNSGNYSSAVIKLNTSGNIDWARTYPEIQTLISLVDNGQDEPIILGNSNSGPYVFQDQLLQIDASGNPINAIAYGKKPANHSALSDVITYNGVFMVSGWRDYQASKTGYQVLFDGDLNTGSCYQKYFIASSSTISVTKNTLTGTTDKSSQDQIEFYGTPATPSYLTGGVYQEYSLDNAILTEITTTGDDCGGSCNGSAIVDALGGDPGYNYTWSNGETTQTASGLCYDDTVTIELSDQLGCYVYDTTIIPQSASTTDICLITVDSTSTRNQVFWEKPNSQAIDGFKIYREVVGNYNLVGYVPYSALSEFTDSTAGVDPNITSYRYKMTTVDTCGNESALSAYHETIHVTVNQGTGGQVNLIWDNYEGIPFSYNRILRDDNGTGNWQVIDSVANTVFTFTDVPPSTQTQYMIEVFYSYTCTSTRANNHNTTRSNRIQPSGGPSNGIENLDIAENVRLYPNPAEENVTYKILSPAQGSGELKIIDATGRVVYREHVELRLGPNSQQIAVDQFETGIYQVVLTVDKFRAANRLMVQ